MRLETMQPNPTFDADAYADVVAAFAALDDDTVIRVWGGDWCKDCRALLPDVGAVLEAAGIPDDRVIHHVVDEDKQGPGVDEYGIEFIPTIVIERETEDGSVEIVRFVEEEAQPPAVYLAELLREQGAIEA